VAQSLYLLTQSTQILATAWFPSLQFLACIIQQFLSQSCRVNKQNRSSVYGMHLYQGSSVQQHNKGWKTSIQSATQARIFLFLCPDRLSSPISLLPTGATNLSLGLRHPSSTCDVWSVLCHKKNVCQLCHNFHFSNNFTDMKKIKQRSLHQKVYNFCLMVEASDHGYVLHTRRIHVTRYRIRYDMI
jgi:hypothetical protein